MSLSTVRISKQLHLHIPVALVFCDVLLESGNDDFVTPFNLLIRFGVTNCCRQLFQAKKIAWRCKKPTHKLSALCQWQMIGYKVWNDPVIEKHIRRKRSRHYWNGEWSCQLQVSVRNTMMNTFLDFVRYHGEKNSTAMKSRGKDAGNNFKCLFRLNHSRLPAHIIQLPTLS